MVRRKKGVETSRPKMEKLDNSKAVDKTVDDAGLGDLIKQLRQLTYGQAMVLKKVIDVVIHSRR